MIITICVHWRDLLLPETFVCSKTTLKSLHAITLFVFKPRFKLSPDPLWFELLIFCCYYQLIIAMEIWRTACNKSGRGRRNKSAVTDALEIPPWQQDLFPLASVVCWFHLLSFDTNIVSLHQVTLTKVIITYNTTPTFFAIIIIIGWWSRSSAKTTSKSRQ